MYIYIFIYGEDVSMAAIAISVLHVEHVKQ